MILWILDKSLQPFEWISLKYLQHKYFSTLWFPEKAYQPDISKKGKVTLLIHFADKKDAATSTSVRLSLIHI